MTSRRPLLTFSVHTAITLCWLVLSSAALAQESPPNPTARILADAQDAEAAGLV